MPLFASRLYSLCNLELWAAQETSRRVYMQITKQSLAKSIQLRHLKKSLALLIIFFSFTNQANAIFRTRILNTDATFSIGYGYPNNTPCTQYQSAVILDPNSRSAVNSPAPYDSKSSTASDCFTNVELATWVDVVGLSQQLTANIDTVKNLETSLKTQKTDITSQIETDHKALSQQIEKVIQELVANPHLIGNNSQTTGNRQALEALITAVVKKELKEAVKLNCQNTIGE